LLPAKKLNLFSIKKLLAIAVPRRVFLFVVSLIVFTAADSYSQIVATPTTGCAPLVGVNFTGVSGATGILWNFGDGTTSSLANPVHTFALAGTYTVNYSATVSGSPVNQSLIIKVFGKPSPAFTANAPLSGCIPLPVTFNDNSVGGGGTAITNWQWAFGDGGVNLTNSGNQTYTYSVGGQFSVSIKVTDANGCDSTLTLTNIINVSPKPTIVLTTSPSPPSACLPPLNVTFTSNGTTSNSSTSNALTYNWSFGNGNTSTAANPPVQTYNGSGVFPVVFVVTDNNGCQDTVLKNVTIQNPTASFTANDTVCMTTTFVNNSTGATVFSWNYGDGNTGLSPTHTYANPGTYSVSLTAYNGACQDDFTMVVVVEEPVANFSVTPTYMCSLPKTISLSNSSTPTAGAVYSWSFLENYTQYAFTPTNSTQINPTFTITNLDTNRYTVYTFDYIDSISLTITTPRGCMATQTIQFVDSIYLPTARFMPDKYQGCVPLTVTFSDSSRSREPIIYYEYNFDDGSPPLTGVQNPVHTYTATGVYYPWLIIHNANGCIDTSYRIRIEVGRPPATSFSLAPTPICFGDSFHFTDLPPESDSVDMWHYYGDGGNYTSSCFKDADPDWPFTHATGAQTVTLEACFRGCCSTASQTLTVNGPLANFSASMDCDSSHVYTFTGTISDATTWDWDFGDGNSAMASTMSTISHSYTATGDYWVYLTAYNPGTGCSPSKDSVFIHVRDIKAEFLYDTLFCTGSPHSFDGTPSLDEYLFGNNGYTWIWDDNTHPDITSLPVTTHSFSSSGYHTVTLIVRDVNGCPDTVKKVLKTFAAVASFVPSQFTVCSVDTIFFTNTSTADTTITGYYWNFGDGTSDTVQNPSHIFNITNPNITKDSITLTITTALGCTNTILVVLNISRPSATFSTLSTVNICAGDSVHFNKPTTYPTMTWNFGDGNTQNGGNTPWHAYQLAGTYSVSLFVKDSMGCTDNKSNALVNVQNKPQVYITSPAFQVANICYPYQGTFTDSSIGSVFSHRIWNLGTGQPVNNSLSTVGTIYPLPGTYTVTLVVYTTNGCVDSTQRSITLYGPVADFSYGPNIICKGQSITFNIKDTSDVFTWHWDFGDGQDTVALSPVSHTFNFHPPGGSTNVTLVYWSDDSSCVQTKVYPVSIYQVVSDFDRNNDSLAMDTAHCLGVVDQFNNFSLGADVYGWSFGDGGTSLLFSPQHQYMAPGTYSVELYIQNNQTGCVDTLVKTMIIYPQAYGTATQDSVCQNQSGQLNAGGGVTYNWVPATGLSCTNCANPVASPTVTTNYSVEVTDVNGCKDTVTTSVYVQLPPNTVTWDTSIVIGETTVLPGYAGTGFTYTWTPVTDLSCTTCPNPVCSSTVDATYTVYISDLMGCFTGQSTFTVYILPLSSVDVPTAFTPNGDGTNDVVYVAGWGIKKLNYFRIYNRWGELVFETNDIKIGWDGTYEGVPQNTETYVYEVSVEPYVDKGKTVFKKGAIKLLR